MQYFLTDFRSEGLVLITECSIYCNNIYPYTWHYCLYFVVFIYIVCLLFLLLLSSTSSIKLFNLNLNSNGSRVQQSTEVVKIAHNKLECDPGYIDQETVSAFSNWPAPSLPWGLLLTKTEDSVLSAATYPQQCTGNECHSVSMLINSANPLWEPNTVEAASLGTRIQPATLSMLPFTAQIGELWD